ncbi:ThiF family adenylyltransferase [Microbacterium fluvii]|uniref:ThiF family adenylyltransferase n=1 Tax=Microbacterium fluvii TaxID=415215 RepID=A0ABW2H9I8_9MICO|nr:ThiF family adenylyltransferase [Microbacterium fluvii]MCU4671642.1 ThiF family adenylyltransferase [Microbacterium fluvii]
MPLPPLVEPVAALSAAESARTARHRVLAGLGDLGQRRLSAAHIAIVGAGGLGSPAVLALAAAGVGTLTVIDDDLVEVANLQRQVMHRAGDVGRRKVDSAVRVGADLSPETQVVAVAERLHAGNAERLLAGAHVVLDGSDTFDTRAAVAAACERLGTPLVWGTVQEFCGQLTVFWSAPPAGLSPVVLGDLYPPSTVGEPPSCSAVGVLGALCLQVGALMATEAVKLIAGIGEPLVGRVLLIDALRARQTEAPLRPAAARDADAAATTPPPLAVADLEAALASGAVLIDVREGHEVAAGAIDGSVHVPLAAVLADPASTAARFDGHRVVVVCAAGARAAQAARALRGEGADAVVLAGGMAAWTLAHDRHTAQTAVAR